VGIVTAKEKEERIARSIKESEEAKQKSIQRARHL
jgi:hypothetical protein